MNKFIFRDFFFLVNIKILKASALGKYNEFFTNFYFSKYKKNFRFSIKYARISFLENLQTFYVFL